ncbi:hypothetical protein K435DRAFT_894760 [Dendrothele bispora CBS 962.96]|uniref:Uncharacterized protein n=1 Tax=Dendrothele bispora (strain CBS 962.96) TaxID=1314807 RepID=A0A4S8KN90_DENBC|nr:hypothetical protein K435DRAFT_894760 [Dendrothele bispora CBS 962.96]
MFLSLLAPELIVLWALKQWFAARQIAKKYSKYGWTKTHGHFLIMGGFALSEDGKSITRSKEPSSEATCLLEFLIQHKYIEITEDEIIAKSKSDFLTKFIAVGQTTWFIVQCIARKAEGLVVIDLEIVTVAFALLNIATYALWWNKPQRVRYPVKIDYCRRHAKSEVKIAKDRSISTRAWTSFTDWIKEPWGDLIRDLWPVRVIIFLLRGTFKFGYNVVNLFNGKDYYHTGLESNSPILYPIVITLFLIFGGVHCIPWNSTFPTHTEQILWRVSAVTVTAFPLLWFPWLGVVRFLADHHTSRTPIILITYPMDMLISPLPLVYIWARITLIVIAFTELRELPPSAYQTVDWARFIPHI